MPEDTHRKSEKTVTGDEFLSPREWYSYFKQPVHSKAWNRSVLYPWLNSRKYKRNEEDYERARKKHPKNFGRGTRIIFVGIRHGDRNPDSTLKPVGKQQARDEADILNLNPDDFNYFNATASYAGTPDVFNLPRSAATAEAYVRHQLDKITPEHSPDRDKTGLVTGGMPEQSEELNYELLKTPLPYDHDAVYNAALVKAYAKAGHLKEEAVDAAEKILRDAENIKDKKEKKQKYSELSAILNSASISAEESLKMGGEAQTVALEHLANLDTPKGVDAHGEGEKYRKEAAGAAAHMILHFLDTTTKMENGAEAAIIGGGHGGTTWEWVLREALVWKNKKTEKIQTGFDSFEDIGGPIRLAESVLVDIVTNKNGKVNLSFQFVRKDRPQGKSTLDMKKLKELSDFYTDLHTDDPKPLTPKEYFENHIKSRRKAIAVA